MDSEIIDRGKSIIEKLSSFDFASLTAMDLIFAVGVITLVILAIKITKKFFKVLLILLAIGLLIGWLFRHGIFSLE